jgi:flavorubredoxin
MKRIIKNNVSWVGKIDWELRKFHGDEYSTHRGSTYNSYLVEEEKVALIDTVWGPFAGEYVANLASGIDLNRIDYVIANHAETDHSGALPAHAPHSRQTHYCTANGARSLKGHYHQDWNFHPVKTGDRLDLGGGKELIFHRGPPPPLARQHVLLPHGGQHPLQQRRLRPALRLGIPLQRPRGRLGASGGVHQILCQHPDALQ